MRTPISPLKPLNRLKTRREKDVCAALYMLLMSGALRPGNIEVRYARPITHEALGRQHSLRPGRTSQTGPASRSIQAQRGPVRQAVRDSTRGHILSGLLALKPASN